MMFTNLEMWLLGWIILVNVLGSLALIFSAFKRLEKFSEKLIFIAIAVTIPLLMLLFVLNEIFRNIDLRKEKKRDKVLSKFIGKKNWVDAFLYVGNLPEAPTWVIDAFENKEIYFVGEDLIVKTSKGDVKVSYEDRILKYADNTLGVMPKDLAQKVSAHE